jgi:hypothetical protein
MRFSALKGRSKWRPVVSFRQDDGSKPTVCGYYTFTRATQSFCLKFDEFNLLLVDLPCGHCRKHFNTIFIPKDTNRCARDFLAI